MEELFTAYKERFQLGDKLVSIKRGYVYIEGSLIKDSVKRMEYMRLLREIVKYHFPPKTKLITVEDFISEQEG